MSAITELEGQSGDGPRGLREKAHGTTVEDEDGRAGAHA